MQLSVEMTQGKELAQKYQGDVVDKTVMDPFTKLVLQVEAKAKQSTVVDTGRLRSSVTHRIGKMEATIGTNVVYACVVGSRHQVYNPSNRTAADIGSYPYDSILSKDGNPHKIIKKHRFYRDSISAVSIKTRQGRNPLIVTDEHLVLILRDGNIIWEQARYISPSDMVMGKRGHNAVTDNSNKISFLCFCGQVFWVEKYTLPFREPKYCSLVCRHKYGGHDQNTGRRWSLTEEQKIKHRGENNHQWRDGSALKPYDFNFNGKLKMIVKERDGFQCQVCHNPFDLVVHHQDWNKMNSSIDNLVTLCRQCHGQLNRQDCELPEVNLSQFVPKPIIELSPVTYSRNGKAGLPHLYDFTVESENSFMVAGLLIHNSFIELGTAKMQSRHMEGGSKILGQGMFAYTLENMAAELKGFETSIVTEMEKALGD